MKVVGVTGGIGSGKSTICKLFSVLGVPVFNSDEVSKQILFSPLGSEQVIKAFGNEICENGTISKEKLGDRVFQNHNELRKLNSILHPLVAEAFVKWKTNQRFPYCIKEAAILFESGGYKSCDYVININCSEEERIKRVLKRDNRTKQQVLDIISRQWSEDKRLEKSNYVINNENQKVLSQVITLHKQLLK